MKDAVFWDVIDRHLLAKCTANFCGLRGVAWSARGIPQGRQSQFSRPEPLLFFQVAPHLSSQRLSTPRSRPIATQKIWQRRELDPGPLGLQPGNVTNRPQRR
jgi:hypothetical protein